MNLNTPVEQLNGIGPSYVKKLKKIGIYSVQDFLFYFPRKYQDLSNIISIKEIKPGQTATIKGTVWQIVSKKAKNRRMHITEAIICDEKNLLKAVWFNQPYLTKSLQSGEEIFLSGRVELKNNQVVMISPVWEKVSKDLYHLGRLVPIYSEIEGLTSRWLRYQIMPLLKFVNNIKDYLPKEVKDRENLIDLSLALKQIHFPSNRLSLIKAKERLAFDELFPILLYGLKLKSEFSKERANEINFDEGFAKFFAERLPFRLTDAQKRVCCEVFEDFKKKSPANRLIQGDVGSGKTVVAALAMGMTAVNRFQSLFIAPTEILAMQHFHKVNELLSGFNIKTEILVGSTKKKDRENIIKGCISGEIDILIGTHSLISPEVIFNKLALAVIDEQHRFGVNQRQSLKKESGNNKYPHFISMTATPIPRSLQLTVFGDLDVSVIDELPPGRQMITTRIVPAFKREAAYNFIKKNITEGRQSFVICSLIEESEKLPLKTVIKEYHNLKNIFSDFRVGLMHGRLKSIEKAKIMIAFKKKELDILVSTSVVEVGVDVPNANIMVIENAERFGLAQLHQFRGRVGRGEHKSYCFLFVGTDINNDSSTSRRLESLVNTNDGFKLAEVDLEIRGPGEFLGTKQAGWSDFKIAKFTDTKFISRVRETANWYFGIDPSFEKSSNLKEKVESVSYARE